MINKAIRENIMSNIIPFKGKPMEDFMSEDAYLGCLYIEIKLLELASTKYSKAEEIVKAAQLYRDFVFREKEELK